MAAMYNLVPQMAILLSLFKIYYMSSFSVKITLHETTITKIPLPKIIKVDTECQVSKKNGPAPIYSSRFEGNLCA